MATYSDDFNRADDPDDLGANWTTDQGELNISSNKAVGVSGAGNLCGGRYTGGSMDSADYYTEADLDQAAGTNGGYVTARATSDPYYYVQQWAGTWGTHRLRKRTSGGWTNLDSWADSGESDPATTKVECDGTAIKGYIAGTERTSATDSDLSAAGAPGITTTWEDRCTFDNFEAADLAAANAMPMAMNIYRQRRV